MASESDGAPARVARILVVEDEQSIGQGLSDVLTYRGHHVIWHTDGAAALSAGLNEAVDLILLDVMLPSLDGWSICRKLRESGNAAGIIMLTAKGAEDDILHGFSLGADDYVTKPFSLAQLLARVEAVLGRSLPESKEELYGADFTVSVSRSTGRGSLGQVELTGREVAILRALLEEPGRIVSRRQLLRDVWQMPNPDAIETRTVDVHMVKLRKKLARVTTDVIDTVRGQGYRMASEK